MSEVLKRVYGKCVNFYQEGVVGVSPIPIFKSQNSNTKLPVCVLAHLGAFRLISVNTKIAPEMQKNTVVF